MKINKTYWIIIGIVGVVAIWYLFLRKKDDKAKEESGFLLCRPDCTLDSYLYGGNGCASGYKLDVDFNMGNTEFYCRRCNCPKRTKTIMN